jgi:hypothetical protein
MSSPGGEIEFIGPFETHYVTVDGWRIPNLRAHPQQGGKVTLTMERGSGVLWDVPLVEAEHIVRFVAEIIAVERGFSCGPRGDERPQLWDGWGRMHGIQTMHAGPEETP